MRVDLLGPTEARLSDGSVAALGGPRVRALLAMLALDAGRVLSPAQLITGIYGEDVPAGAANALQSQVSRLRRALVGDAGLVELHRTGYRLRVGPDTVDAHRFESLAAAGRVALAAGDPSRAAALLREALGLWRGPALADVMEAPFRAGPAARLEDLRCGAIEDRMDAELMLGAHRELVAELTELTGRYPRRERLSAQLIRALHGCGRQAEALERFARVRRALAEEFGAEPGPELRAAHLAVLRDSPAGPSPRPAPTQRLPAQLTSFVGRDAEVARLSALLSGVRLVTLTGPGGAGKTRLAVETAGRSPVEVCFVDLASLRDGSEIPRAVLGALGLHESSLLSPAPVDQRAAGSAGRLVEVLAERPMLLLLDNCEHLVADVALLGATLLSACPALRVLVTSREPLSITGEVVHPVLPLVLPPPGLRPDEAAEFAAVRLFTDRAVAVRPDFHLDAGTVEPVLRICRALDGLPLAIELAAARVRTLTVADVAARLDDRFALLDGANRGAQPRHRTLRAVVAWSWELLDDAERAVARRLTVFAAGARPADIAAVTGVSAAETTEILGALQDKSFLEVSRGSEPRARMLSTVRLFCAEELARTGEHDRYTDAHAARFLQLARKADEHLRGPEQLDWLERLDADRDNLHTALRRYTGTGDRESALHMVAALSTYWWIRGLQGAGAALARDVLALPGPAEPRGAYVLAVLNAAAGDTGDSDLRARLDEVERELTGLQTPPAHPFVALLWPMTAGIAGRHAGIPPLLEAARSGSDAWMRSAARLGEGYLALGGGRVAEAERCFTLALDGFRSRGDRWGSVLALNPLAELAVWRGDEQAALGFASSALRLAEDLGAVEDMADVLCRQADVLLHLDDLDGAAAGYERAAELARRAGARDNLAAAYRGRGDVARLRGDLVEAGRLQRAALAACDAGRIGAETVRSSILVALGRVAEAEQDLAGAGAWYARALAACSPRHDLLDAARVAEAMAGAVLLAGDPAGSARLLGVGVALRGAAIDGHPDTRRTVGAARRRLSADDFRTAFDQGAAMAVGDALELLVRVPSRLGA